MILTFYVIYDKPLDYPNHFVVRRHFIASEASKTIDPRDVMPTDDPGVVCERTAQLTLTLEDARMLIPQGLHRLPRELNDDPNIVEVWI